MYTTLAVEGYRSLRDVAVRLGRVTVVTGEVQGTLRRGPVSLHESLIGPLARLILHAAARAQIVVVTHSMRLAELLNAGEDVEHVHLLKDTGETIVADQGLLTRPAWEWGSR